MLINLIVYRLLAQKGNFIQFLPQNAERFT